MSPIAMTSSFFVHQTGFEPTTDSLEGCCSIQLSYWCENVVTYIWTKMSPSHDIKGFVHLPCGSFPNYFDRLPIKVVGCNT